MKEEHYRHVCEHFNLRTFNENNALFFHGNDDPVESSKLVADGGRIRYNNYTVFGSMPHDLTPIVLQYIIDTEVLFI